MFNKHLIIENENSKTLYLFLDFNYEFSKEFKAKGKKSKEKSLYKDALNYITKNKIDFKFGRVFLVVGSLVIGSLFINNYGKENFQYNLVPKYKYVESVDIFNDETYKNVVEKEKINIDNNISKTGEGATTNASQPVASNSNTSVVNKPPVSTSVTPSNPITQPITENATTIPPSNPIVINQPSNQPVEVIETPIPSESVTPVVQEKMVTLYRYNGTVETITLEDYVVGVVAAEMPAAFNAEALKAQSVLARTYALKKVDNNQVLSDTTSNQVYKDINELKKMWGTGFDNYYSKVVNAVSSTKGQYLTYNGSYIEAVYHSTSNGMTEDSVAVWGNSYPYLKSVDSHWDLSASSFLRETSKEYSLLSSIIGLDFNATTNVEVLSRTSSNRIDKIKIGDKIYSGIEVRTLLGLRSTDFEIKMDDGKAIFITKGYGHGVGMSQYGANGMANEGYKYDQILSHYYPTTQLKKLS